MANSSFSKIVKSLWVLVSFIPIVNGLGFAYIGAKEFNSNWIKEGLIYEAPWFLLFLFLFSEGMSVLFVGLGFLLQLISIIRSFMVYFQNKDVLIEDDDESRVVVEKSISSFWMILSFIPYLSGLGIIFIGLKRNVKNWIMEGLVYEFLWILVLIIIALGGNPEFFVSLAMIGLILGIVKSFIIYFEEERMNALSLTPKTIADTLKIDTRPKQNENSNDIYSNEVIPEFKAYDTQINDLKNTFDKKEESITDLIEKRFSNEELSYDRFMSVIKNCHKIFYHQANSASSIIHLAPEYSDRLDESVKGKISILESIIDEMNSLIEEFILHDGSDEKSEEDLQELFANMDNLIGSVKDYK